MKKSKSVEPPKVATWLLERFSPESEPLAGDLMEAFKHGRSSGWYWRQVFVAILIALPLQVRRRCALWVYAATCSAVISIAWFLMFPNAAHGSVFPRAFALYARSYGIDWPWSFVYQISFITTFQAALVWMAFIAYLSFSRQLQRGSLLRGLAVVLVVLAISNVALPLVAGFLGGFQWFGWVVVSAPPAIAFILSNWKPRGHCGSLTRRKSV